MSDSITNLVERLRTLPDRALWHEAANALEQRASRIAELEHTAVNAKPVGYFLNVNQPGMKVRYSQISEKFRNRKDVFAFFPPPVADSAMEKNGERYRYPRDINNPDAQVIVEMHDGERLDVAVDTAPATSAEKGAEE
ncbi:hypothetical protein [Paraburkholderia sp. SIMBA_054]|uniref:hypothetical protein n=1 Tax=Paraburkholderia sp. SIMBA_054 TaxID=3085795 RepID=UPI00397DF9E6